MFANLRRVTNLVLGLALIGAGLLLTACGADTAAPTATAPTPTTAAPTPTVIPPVTAAPTPTTAAPAATETAVPESGGTPGIALDLGAIASGYQVETIPAPPAGSDVPYWGQLPEHTVITLEGYPISKHLMRPQIFIYPLPALQAANEGAGQIAAALQTLLAAPQELPSMPFLPLFNAAQVMHAQVQYLDFATGQGLRYVTQFDQAFLPINNNELIFTYQGLTDDGRFYVAAVLPVTHPSLPADASVTGNEPPEFSSDFQVYLANVTGQLNTAASSTYVPDLAGLDAMLRSLQIR